MTPKGPRPTHLRAVGKESFVSSPADEVIDSGGRELLAEGDPIAAEMWASAILDMFERAAWQARLDHLEVPPFEEFLLGRCRERGDRFAVVVAAALAAVVPATHTEFAASVMADLQGAVAASPSWIRSIGRATPTRGWIASDPFGDQESLIIGFRQEGRPGEHALAVLVDHNLSGQAKDAWVGPDVGEMVASWKSAVDPNMRLDEVPVAMALQQLHDAMATSDLWDGDTELRTEDFGRFKALVWARLRRQGVEGHPIEIDVPRAERQRLVREFMASREGQFLIEQLPRVDVEILAQYVVDLRSDYEGRPLRWSPTVVSVLLGDLAPRKLLLGPDQVKALPSVVRGLVRFSAERTGLGRPFIDETLASVDEIEAEYFSSMASPGAAGPAKAMLAALQARGVDLTDMDAINDALGEAGPLKLRRPSPKYPRRAAAASAPQDAIASAASAPVLARFEALTGFWGGGRKLTQTGQPTLADARQLVVLLGTKDRFDETIGDHTFKTKSAAELPELGFMLRWAVSAGALRKEHGKLRSTTAWGKLEGKPVQRWTRAADAVLSLGPLAAFRAHNRYRSRDEIVDDLVLEILLMLEGGAMAFDEVLDWVCDRADATYEWLAPYLKGPEDRRTFFRRDLDLLARILGWAAIADRTGGTLEPDRYEQDRLVGGTLQLTASGRWWMDGPR